MRFTHYSNLPSAKDERRAQEIKDARQAMSEFFDAYECANLDYLTTVDAALLKKRIDVITQALRTVPSKRY